MAGRLNRPLPADPTGGRSPQPVPRHTNGSPVGTPRSRPKASLPQRQVPKRRPPTPPDSDEEYDEPSPATPNANKKTQLTQHQQLLQRRLPTPPDSNEEYDEPAPAPTETYKQVPPLPQQQGPQRPVPQRRAPQRLPPTPPATDEYEEPAPARQEDKKKMQPPQAPQRRHPTEPDSDEEYEAPAAAPTETYSEVNESVSRPALPAPKQPQNDYPVPGQEGWSGPTEEYTEISRGTDPNLNLHHPPPPPQIPQGLYQKDMPDTAPEAMIVSSLQKEILGKQLKTSTHELPPNLHQEKVINGFQMVRGINSVKIRDAKGGLKPVARNVSEQKSPNHESIAPDPSVVDFHAKAAVFGQKVAPHTAPCQPSLWTIVQEDMSSPHITTSSNTSLQGNRSSPPVPQPRRQPVATPTKKQLPSKPMPDVPNSKRLLDYPWYFDNLVREDANSKLRAMRQDGAYLIRNSTKDPSKPYTLSLLYKKRVWHLHIRIRNDGMFAVGFEKPEEEYFASVPELIKHHTEHSIVLAESDEGGIRLITHPTYDTSQHHTG